MVASRDSSSLIVRVLKAVCFAWGALLLLPPALLAAAIALSIEAGYRLICYLRICTRHRGRVSIFDQPQWEYDPQFGFRYLPNIRTREYLFEQGRPNGYCMVYATNEYGNVNHTTRQDYERAQVKGLVFGDSFTAIPTGEVGGLTWPDLLQRKLADRWQTSVALHNFGRDGYSILQMVELAAEKVAEFKPDFVLIGFISGDLMRSRAWRFNFHDGRYHRVRVTNVPQPNPKKPEGADAFIICPQLTIEKFRQIATTADGDDGLLREIRAQCLFLQRQAHRHVNFLSTKNSFLWDQTFYGDPFIRFKPSDTVPTMELWDYAHDDRFVEGVRRLRASAPPIFAINLPQHHELKAGKPVRSLQQQSLYNSLERLLGVEIVSILGQYRGGAGQVDRHYRLEEVGHPSALGLEYYAQAVCDRFPDQPAKPLGLKKTAGFS